MTGTSLILRPVNASLTVKALRVSLPQLINIGGQNIIQIFPDCGSCDRQIPRYITKLFGKVVNIKIVALKSGLFHKVSYFAGLTAQS